MIKTNTNAIVNEELLHEEVPFKLEVGNITQLTKAQLDQLKAGDVVVKVTGKQRHSYRVSYKGEGAGEGICLTYSDASVVETVSYDRSGSNWVYNSTDVMPLVNVEDASSGKIKDVLGLDTNGDLVKGTISSGTIQDVLGLDTTGDLVKGTISGGTKLYKHSVSFVKAQVSVYYRKFNSDGTFDTVETQYNFPAYITNYTIYIINNSSSSLSGGSFTLASMQNAITMSANSGQNKILCAHEGSGSGTIEFYFYQLLDELRLYRCVVTRSYAQDVITPL